MSEQVDLKNLNAATVTDFDHVRGDSATLEVQIVTTVKNPSTASDADKYLQLQDATVRFTARSSETKEVIIEKDNFTSDEVTITAPTKGTLEVEIKPSDTKGLDLSLHPVLDYDVEVTTVEGRVYTPSRGAITLIEDQSQ